MNGHTDWINAVVALPDGQRFVSASTDHTLKVWDVDRGEVVCTLVGHTASVGAVAMLPDGRRAVSASDDQTLRVWDTETGVELLRLTGHTAPVRAVAAFPDGYRVISTSQDRTLKVWDLRDGKEVRTLTGHADSVRAVAVMPEGHRALSASNDHTLRLWDLESGAELQRLTGHTDWVRAVAVLPEEPLTVSASNDRTLRVWDLESGTELRTMVGHTGWVWTLAVLPGGSAAISGSDDNTLRVWDLMSGVELRKLTGHTGWVRTVAVLPGGRRVISASDDTTLRVWDVESGVEQRSLPSQTPRESVFLSQAPIKMAIGVFRLIRSAAGPSTGIVNGGKFEFDNTVNRFVYPRDKSLAIGFEWEGQAGKHVLSGIWKGPDGRTAFVSPDVKKELRTTRLDAHWVHEITSGMASGVWTLEVRIDGKPAGAHSFELIVPEREEPRPEQPPAPVTPQGLRPAQLYQSAIQSMVWIHKVDDAGGRAETASGFVISPNCVATAFDVIDGATQLEVEFSGGRRITSKEVWAWQRLEDWALVRVDTGDVPSLQRGDPEADMRVERLTAFTVEAGMARVMRGVEITDRNATPGSSGRIQIAVPLSRGATGGPLVNSSGEVVGLIGSLRPRTNCRRPDRTVNSDMISPSEVPFTVTPITKVPQATPAPASTLKILIDNGTLTPPLAAAPRLVVGGIAAVLPIDMDEPFGENDTEFSRQAPSVWVYALWQRTDKRTKGVVTATVFDGANRPRADATPQKITLPEKMPVRTAFNFSPSQFEPGLHRVDILWDSQPVWRSFFSIFD